MLESDIASVCRSHLEFTKWADEIMLSALLQAPADKVTADLGSSFKSLFETLNHVYLAELVWLKRVQGDARLADLPVPPDPNALAQATLLRQSGLTPPATDLVAFYRTR